MMRKSRQDQIDFPQNKFQKTFHDDTTDNSANMMIDEGEDVQQEENIICVNLIPKKSKLEISILLNNGTRIECDPVFTHESVSAWLSQTLDKLLPSSSTTTTATTATSSLEQVTVKFIYNNSKILSLSHKNGSLWEKGKILNSLKLIIQVPNSNTMEFTVDYMNHCNAIGNDKFRDEAYQEAIHYYTLGMNRFPNSIKSLCNRALCYARLHNWRQCIQDLNDWFTQVNQQKRELTFSKGDISLVPKAYLRRARAYSALASVIDQHLQKSNNNNNSSSSSSSNENSSDNNEEELLNYLSSRENILQIIQQHTTLEEDTVDFKSLIVNDASFDSTALFIHKLTLLQLAISDFSRIPDEFTNFVKQNDKKKMNTNADASLEYDIAIWNLLQHAPSKLNVCTVTRRPVTTIDTMRMLSVIPSEWTNLNSDQLYHHISYPFLLTSTDAYSRINRYEKMFVDNLLNPYYYNTETIDTVSIDQSSNSWCSFVLSWLCFKHLWTLPNLNVLFGNSYQSETYNFFMRLRRYLVIQFETKNASNELPEKIYPIRFSVYATNAKEEQEHLIRIVESYEGTETPILKMIKMKFGKYLNIAAAKHEVLSFYQCRRGMITHGNDTMIEPVDPSRLPSIFLF
jgi:hypothetical protein